MEWSSPFVITAIIVAGLASIVLFVRRPLHNWWRRQEAQQAARLFRIQREQLEAKFFDLAAAHGKPRGLRWLECDWQNPVTFARDMSTGLLTAFVGVNIRFEAIEGGDMEDVEAVGTVRDAAAVFHFRNGRWGTGGRALFNLNPQDALARLAGQFEPVVLAVGALSTA